MSDALRKIEEQYAPDDAGFCEIPPVQDFLKLARALDTMIALDPCACGDCLRCDARRTLEEVAGE